MNKRILIIDDDLDMCTLLSKFLCKKGYDADAALSASKGIAKVVNGFFDIVLCDFRLGDKNGKDVLVKIKELSPETIVIIITGYSDIKTAVDVIKLGAFDYITKPLVPDEVINVIEKALASPLSDQTAQQQKLSSQPGQKKKIYELSSNNEYLIGQDTETSKIYRQIEMVAPTNYS